MVKIWNLINFQIIMVINNNILYFNIYTCIYSTLNIFSKAIKNKLWEKNYVFLTKSKNEDVG